MNKKKKKTKLKIMLRDSTKEMNKAFLALLSPLEKNYKTLNSLLLTFNVI